MCNLKKNNELGCAITGVHTNKYHQSLRHMVISKTYQEVKLIVFITTNIQIRLQ